MGNGAVAYENGWSQHFATFQISTCVGFQALAKANSKFSVGLRYTGTNAAVCGRSEMVFPMGVGNLQKGEKYVSLQRLTLGSYGKDYVL